MSKMLHDVLLANSCGSKPSHLASCLVDRCHHHESTRDGTRSKSELGLFSSSTCHVPSPIIRGASIIRPRARASRAPLGFCLLATWRDVLRGAGDMGGGAAESVRRRRAPPTPPTSRRPPARRGGAWEPRHGGCRRSLARSVRVASGSVRSRIRSRPGEGPRQSPWRGALRPKLTPRSVDQIGGSSTCHRGRDAGGLLGPPGLGGVGAHSAGPWRRITAGSAAAHAGAGPLSHARSVASVPSRVDRTSDRQDPRDHDAWMTRGDRVLAGLPTNQPFGDFFPRAGECQARRVHSPGRHQLQFHPSQVKGYQSTKGRPARPRCPDC